MFGGLIETIGTIVAIVSQQESLHFEINPQIELNDLSIGDSIAVNGVCLSVTDIVDHNFFVTAVPETLRITNLGKLIQYARVNLERSLKVNARLGGHFVQGHVDGVSEILSIEPAGAASLIKIRVPTDLTKYIVKKGYISLDGMSITVIDVGVDWFTVTFIPLTQQSTIVQFYKVGTLINIEVDILGKYVEKLLKANKDIASA